MNPFVHTKFIPCVHKEGQCHRTAHVYKCIVDYCCTKVRILTIVVFQFLSAVCHCDGLLHAVRI